MDFFFNSILQMLKKMARFVQEQNDTVYFPRGLMIIDPAERGLRVVSLNMNWWGGGLLGGNDISMA